MKPILPLIMCCLLFGCDRDSGGLDTTVEITAIDEFTGKVLPNERFQFKACPSGGVIVLIGDNCDRENYVTDAEGKLSFEFVTQYEWSYGLLYLPDDVTWDNLAYMAQKRYSINRGRKNKKTYVLTPTAKLGVRYLHDPSSEFNNFGCWLIRECPSGDPYKYSQGESFRNLNQSLDSTVYYTVMQDQTYSLEGGCIQWHYGKQERII